MAEEPPSNSSFSHEELLKITSSVLNELISKDSYLSDLPVDVTCDEVNSQIELLHGQSITINVIRADQILSVVVPQSSCRVSDLKRSIRRAVDLKLKREDAKRKVSWRYVWRTYHLQYNDVTLADDNELIGKLGMHHKSRVHFVKRRRQKGFHSGRP